jgi:hypothetical protein
MRMTGRRYGAFSGLIRYMAPLSLDQAACGRCVMPCLAGESLAASGSSIIIKALDDMVFLLDIYAKKQKENLTRGEINEIKKLVGRL